MSVFDASRQQDVVKMEHVLHDPAKSPAEKKKAESALYAIREQAKHPSIAKLRRDITEAHMRGDQKAIDRLTREAQRIDRDYTN